MIINDLTLDIKHPLHSSVLLVWQKRPFLVIVGGSQTFSLVILTKSIWAYQNGFN